MGKGSKQAICQECVAIRDRRRNSGNADGDKYCDRHQCPYLDAQGRKCSQRKSKEEEYCSLNHCRKPQCPHQANGKTHLCPRHSCKYKGCTNSLDGGEEQIYCFEFHKCSEQGCQNIRKPILTDGDHAFRDHCKYHECQNKSCTACKVEGKDHCTVHYCKEDACRDEGLLGLDTKHCLRHHNLPIEKKGKEKGIAEERIRHQEEDARLKRELTRLREHNLKVKEEGIAEERARAQQEHARLRRELTRLWENNLTMKEKGREEGIVEERSRVQQEHTTLRREVTRLQENNLMIKEKGREEGILEERARVQEEHASLRREVTRLQENNLTIKEKGRDEGIVEERARIQKEHARLWGELTRLRQELARVRERFGRGDPNHDPGYASRPASESDFGYHGY